MIFFFFFGRNKPTLYSNLTETFVHQYKLFHIIGYAYSFNQKIAPFDPRKTTTSFSFTFLGKAFKLIISIWICFRLYISISHDQLREVSFYLLLDLWFAITLAQSKGQFLLKCRFFQDSFAFLVRKLLSFSFSFNFTLLHIQFLLMGRLL